MRWLFLGSSRHLNLALFLSVDRVATYLRGRRLPGESGSAEVVEFREAIFEFSAVFHLMRTDARPAAAGSSRLGLSAQDGRGLGSKSWERL